MTVDRSLLTLSRWGRLEVVTSFDELLAAHATVVLDGGMGSTLEDWGVNVQNPLWGSVALLTEEGRSINDRVHRAFIDAGAQIIIANTHNASLQHCCSCQGRDAHDLLEHVNSEALASARRARGAEPVAIAGCVASPDTPYTTVANLSASEVAERITPQVEVLMKLDFDLILFEMMTTRADLEGVARVVQSLGIDNFGVGIPCKDGCSLGGVSMASAAALLSPTIFFVQCTSIPEVEPALSKLQDRLVGVYANDGRIWVEDHWEGERVSPEVYVDHAERWRDLGARVIGGCCGTGPEHIKALADRFR